MSRLAQPSGSPFQIRGEQLERAIPRVLCFGGAMDIGAGVVEKSMRASLVNLDLARLAELFQRRRQPIDVAALNPSVVLAVRVENRAAEMLEFFVRRYFAIERRRGRDFPALARQQDRVAAAHTKSGDADAG